MHSFVMVRRNLMSFWRKNQKRFMENFYYLEHEYTKDYICLIYISFSKKIAVFFENS